MKRVIFSLLCLGITFSYAQARTDVPTQTAAATPAAAPTVQLAQPFTLNSSTFTTYLNSLPDRNRPTDPQVVVDAATRGENLVQDILSGKITTPSSPQDIIDIQSYLYARSVEQGDKFIAGMTTIKDPSGKLYQFFENYSETYDRWSSHTDSQLTNQFGIDLPDGSLAVNKSTILIQKLTDGTFRLKSEYHGFRSFADKIKHMITYFQTRGEEGAGKKEHVPDDVKQEFKKILQNNRIMLTDDEAIATSMQKKGGITILGKNFFGKEVGGGIKEMLTLLDNKTQDLQTQIKSAADQSMKDSLQEDLTKLQNARDGFVQYLAENKGYDINTLYQRKGNESVVDLSGMIKVNAQKPVQKRLSPFHKEVLAELAKRRAAIAGKIKPKISLEEVREKLAAAKTQAETQTEAHAKAVTALETQKTQLEALKAAAPEGEISAELQAKITQAQESLAQAEEAAKVEAQKAAAAQEEVERTQQEEAAIVAEEAEGK